MATSPPVTSRICQQKTDSDDIIIDPEFEALIPPLSEDELAGLQRRLDEEGCLHPLLVWAQPEGKTLLDGHNRLRHCRAKGYSFPVLELSFATREEAREEIRRVQTQRRNLSPLAWSYLRGQDYLRLKRQGKRTDKTSGQSDQKLTTAQRLVDEYKVSEKTIRRDAELARALEFVEKNCGSEARNQLLARGKGLTHKLVCRLGKDKPATQKEFLAQLKAKGCVPRLAVRKIKTKRLMLPREVPALAEALEKQMPLQELTALSECLVEIIARLASGQQLPGEKKRRARAKKTVNV